VLSFNLGPRARFQEFAITIPRFMLALFLSIVITFVLSAAYLLYQMLPILGRVPVQSSNSEGHSPFSMSGGIRSSTQLIIEVIVFAVLLLLFYRRPTNA
jgi:uncharacterized BrkB/YihY/UPF0761 family membrane protein